MKHRQRRPNDLIDVRRTRLQRLLAGEDEHALDQFSAVAGRLHGSIQALSMIGAGGSPHQLQRVHDDGEHVVEIVSDAARQLAQRLHLLRLMQFLPGLVERGRALLNAAVELFVSAEQLVLGAFPDRDIGAQG